MQSPNQHPLGILFLSLLIALLAWSGASASPIILSTDSNAFYSSLPPGTVLSTETFDEFSPDTDLGIGSIVLNGIAYTSANPSAVWFASDSFVPTSAPNALVQRNVIAPAILTFPDQGSTNAIGFFLIGIGGVPPAEFQINVAATDGGVLLDTILIGTITTNVFRGFRSEAGILSVRITPVDVGNISNFHLDDVTHAQVIPEPSTALMTGIGLIGMYYRRRLARGVATALAQRAGS